MLFNHLLLELITLNQQARAIRSNRLLNIYIHSCCWIKCQSHLFRNVALIRYIEKLIYDNRKCYLSKDYECSWDRIELFPQIFGKIFDVFFLSECVFKIRPQVFGTHLLTIFKWCRSLEWSFFFSSMREPVLVLFFRDSTHQLNIIICINQRAGYKSVHFLAVTLDLYTHLRRAINFNQSRLHRTTGIITVSLIELLGVMTLLHQTVNELLTLWPFSLAFVPLNRALWLVNLSKVFQIDRLSMIDLLLLVY